MGYALALSLALHIGAALVFIIAGGFRVAGEKTNYLHYSGYRTDTIDQRACKNAGSTTRSASRNDVTDANSRPGSG